MSRLEHDYRFKTTNGYWWLKFVKSKSDDGWTTYWKPWRVMGEFNIDEHSNWE